MGLVCIFYQHVTEQCALFYCVVKRGMCMRFIVKPAPGHVIFPGLFIASFEEGHCIRTDVKTIVPERTIPRETNEIPVDEGEIISDRIGYKNRFAR